MNRLIVRLFKLYDPEQAGSIFAHNLRRHMRRAAWAPHMNHEVIQPKPPRYRSGQ